MTDDIRKAYVRQFIEIPFDDIHAMDVPMIAWCVAKGYIEPVPSMFSHEPDVYNNRVGIELTETGKIWLGLYDDTEPEQPDTETEALRERVRELEQHSEDRLVGIKQAVKPQQAIKKSDMESVEAIHDLMLHEYVGVRYEAWLALYKKHEDSFLDVAALSKFAVDEVVAELMDDMQHMNTELAEIGTAYREKKQRIQDLEQRLKEANQKIYDAGNELGQTNGDEHFERAFNILHGYTD